MKFFQPTNWDSSKTSAEIQNQKVVNLDDFFVVEKVQTATWKKNCFSTWDPTLTAPEHPMALLGLTREDRENFNFVRNMTLNKGNPKKKKKRGVYATVFKWT